MRETVTKTIQMDAFHLTTHNPKSTKQRLALPNPTRKARGQDTEPLDIFTTEARQLKNTTLGPRWHMPMYSPTFIS
jgi:hypothetical protein